MRTRSKMTIEKLEEDKMEIIGVIIEGLDVTDKDKHRTVEHIIRYKKPKIIKFIDEDRKEPTPIFNLDD